MVTQQVIIGQPSDVTSQAGSYDGYTLERDCDDDLVAAITEVVIAATGIHSTVRSQSSRIGAFATMWWFRPSQD